MSQDHQDKYPNHPIYSIFAIEPKSNIISLELDIEDTPLPHDNYKIYNIGRSHVYVKLLCGKSEKWEKVAEECAINPGQTVIFDNVGKLFRISGIKIYNKTEIRAVVSCAQAAYCVPVLMLREPVIDRDYSNKLRETYSVGVRYVPYINETYQGLYTSFWPPNKLNVWDEIMLKLQPLLKNDIFQAVSVTVNESMKNIQHKLIALSKSFDEGQSVLNIYMEISKDLSEFEEKLNNKNDDASYNTTKMLFLPLFSNFILLKTIFFSLGIITASDIGFSPENMYYIENNLRLSKNATKYIRNMLSDRLNHAYKTSHPQDLYNSMMNVRSYVGIHGTECSRIWDSITRSPFTGDKVFNDVISYSNLFGSQTPNLIREATTEKMYPPLTPVYIGFIYNYLIYIEVYLWINHSSPESRKIGGMKLVFADNSSYIMGTKTELIEHIGFKEAYIAKLKVTGNGAVDSCKFYMSDGRKLFFGTKEKDSKEESFELKNHRIVSIFLSSDNDSLGGQAANIAVSYRLNNVWEYLG